MFVEYTDWVIKATSERTKNDFRYKMLSKRTKTSIQYWLVDGLPFPTLREVAINVFSMVTSSAASERGFSTMGFVHSKLRNRLAADKVQKLVFIKNNALCTLCLIIIIKSIIRAMLNKDCYDRKEI